MSNTTKFTFGTVNGDITQLQDVSGDDITTTREKAIDERVFGEYQYENTPLFGSPTESNNRFILDMGTNTITVFIEHDSPTPRSIFDALEETTDVDIIAPVYDSDVTRELYDEFGCGHSVSFRRDRRTFIDGLQRINPQDIAQERALHSSETVDSLSVSGIIENHFENEYFVESMKLNLPSIDTPVKFTAPSHFSLVPKGLTDETVTELYTILEPIYNTHTTPSPQA